MGLKEALEWLALAGVSETCGDAPLRPEEKKQPQPPITNCQLPITSRSLDSVASLQTARELCESAATLEELKKALESFDGCALKSTAKSTVFADGDPQARIVFIGEAPGADEDRIGKPFVGRSGQLLDKMMAAAGLTRKNACITNILPWRPPGNRTPTSGEIAVCLPFVKRQLDIIEPDVVVMLGGSAANAVLGNAEPISRLRGKWLEYKTASGHVCRVLATFHPAYLLRNTAHKAKAWADMLKLQKELG